jgi:hypothetical protein
LEYLLISFIVIVVLYVLLPEQLIITIEGIEMSRLSEKLAAAAAVAPRQAAKIEARADRIIAMEPEIERQTDDAFVPH